MSNVLVLEDNVTINQQVAKMLTKIKGIKDIIQVYEIEQAEAKISEMEFDLMVVDLELPDGNGHEFIRNTRKMKRYENTNVVVITGYVEAISDVLNAINSMECHLYFQKPIVEKEFVDDITRLIGQRPVEETPERIEIKMKQMTLYFDVEDIVFVETINNKTIVHCVDGDHDIGRYSLSKFEKSIFFPLVRVHRAYIVNANKLSSIKKAKNLTTLVLLGAFEIPIGVSYKAELSDKGIL